MMDDTIENKALYLERMSKPLQEKLRVARYISSEERDILDVGCADGTVTRALAHLFPDKQFLGIDLDESFINLASQKAKEEGLTNVRFEKVYLRDLLARSERYDSVLFISVLHEFFTYGEGISSVLKALADAEELLKPGGDIVIRDMILMHYTKRTEYLVDGALKKIREAGIATQELQDFESHYGPITTVYSLNHFLLKYMYRENWARELIEHYVPVSFEEYEQIFALLGMELVLRDAQLLPYLSDKWKSDFALTPEELAPLASTGFLVGRKKI